MITSEQALRYNIVLDWVADTVTPNGVPTTALDIGCHEGTLCRWLAERGANVTGIDVYETELKGVDEPWTYVRQDLNAVPRFPFADGTFTVVTALEILEHILDTDLFLQEVWRVLKPGGVFCLSTPNINMLKNRLRVPFGLYPYGLEWHTVVHHVRLYNLDVLLSHLRQTKFEILDYRGTHLVPQRYLESRFARKISDRLATYLPRLASNLMIKCQKPGTGVVNAARDANGVGQPAVRDSP